MPFKRFSQANPLLTLGLIVAAWLLLPTALKTLARASFFELTAPVTLAASRVRDLQDFWALRARSRTELIEHIYDQDFDRDSNTIEVFVTRIRKKLGQDVISTIRGLGYSLEEPVS